MNLEQKIDAVLTAVQTPATVDVNALAVAIAAALKPSFDAIAAGQATAQTSLTDIQGQVDEPAAPAPVPTPEAAPAA